MKPTKFLAVAALLIILNSILVNASCEEDQININTASKSELQKIDNIGPVYANRTINQRPFNSLEEITKVKGIAEGRLKDIKNQGLACVEGSSEKESSSDEKTENEEKDSNENEETNKENSKTEEKEANLESRQESQSEQSEKQENLIKLSNTKDIKNQTDKSNSINKEKLSRYGLIGLTILVIFLFIAREIKHKKKYKNEFG